MMPGLMVGSRSLLLVLGLVGLALTGCRSDETQTGGATTGSATAADLSSGQPTTSQASAVSAEQRAAWAACAEQHQAVQKEPALPGAPLFEQRRVHFARVRGRSLLWRRAPKTESTKLDEQVKKNKTALAAVKGLLRKNKSRERRRELFLREGYLYHDQVEVALALVEMIGLTGLFDEPSLYLQRGAQTYELKRLKRTRYLPERYGYQNGPLKGETAEILLGDRVALQQEALAEPLALDLRDALQQGEFDRIRVNHLSAKTLAAEVRYGADHWVPAVFDLDGPQLKLRCEAFTEQLWQHRQEFIDQQELRRRAVRRLRQVIQEEVREQIPFDAAPENENGFLRKAWTRAYLAGWRRFTHRDRKYDVYSTEGAPIPPQVCIDFIADTWERAAGSWFAPLSGDPPRAHPAHTDGPIDVDHMDLKNRRSVAKFVEFTKRHADLFDTWELPPERVPFSQRDPFFEYLAAHTDQFLPGDVIILHGYKEGGRPHYHSLFITQVDPITGVPTRVAGNAVFPREQTLEGIMQISPKRSIRYRIRLREPWLKYIAAKAAAEDDNRE